MKAILNRAPVSPLRLNADLPPKLEEIIGKSLEKDRRLRYQNASDLRADLQRLKRDTESGRSAVVPAAPADAPHLRLWWILVPVTLLAAVAAFYYFAGRPTPIDSVAVLPFANTSGDPNTEYLSDGITENLINNLSQLPQMRVVPRSTAFSFKGKAMDPQKTGHDLKVRAVLTGRVLQRGDTLNIQADLVDIEHDSQLWGKQYERKVSDLLAVQEEITREVSGKLRPALNADQKKQLARPPTENAEAYRAYLQGRYYESHWSQENMKKAAGSLNQAIALEPSFAQAYAALAEVYALESDWSISPQEALPKIRAAATRALELDENLPDGHSAWRLPRCTIGIGRERKRNSSARLS